MKKLEDKILRGISIGTAIAAVATIGVVVYEIYKKHQIKRELVNDALLFGPWMMVDLDHVDK